MADVSFSVEAVDQASAVFNKMDSSLLGMAKSAIPAAAAFTSLSTAGLKVIDFLKKSVQAAAESERVMVRLNATLISTGRSADINAEKVGEFASKLSRLTTFDDEAVISAYDAVSRFSQIKTQDIEKITAAATDMTAALGGDLAGNATTIARILETGTIPRTLGFSEALKNQIKAAQDAGDTGKTLSLVLEELNRRFGGQAAALVNTYTGSVEKLANSWENYTEVVGDKGLPTLTKINLSLAQQADNAVSAAESVDKLTDAEKRRFLLALSGGNYAQANRVIDEYNDLLLEATNQTGDLTRVGNEFALVVAGQGGGLSELSEKYGAIIDYAKSYTDYQKDMSALEDELALKRGQGYGETGKTITEIKSKIEELQAAQEKQTASWIAGLMLQQLSVDGLDSAEMAFLLNYQVNTGLLSEEAAKRAQIEYDQYLKIMEIYEKIPSGKVVTIDFILGASAEAIAAVGTAVPYEEGKYSQRASGGPAKGFFIAGDPGPQEELVYAPGGAYVFPANKTRAMKQKGRYPHFALGNLPMIDQAIGNQTSNPWQSIMAGTGYITNGGYYGGVPTYTQSGQQLTQTQAQAYGNVGAQVPASSGGGYYTPTSPAGAQAAQATQTAVQAAVAAASATQSVSQAAATISASGEKTAQATMQQTQQNNSGNQMIIERLKAIENLLQKNFDYMPKQWASAAARIVQP